MKTIDALIDEVIVKKLWHRNSSAVFFVFFFFSRCRFIVREKFFFINLSCFYSVCFIDTFTQMYTCETKYAAMKEHTNRLQVTTMYETNLKHNEAANGTPSSEIFIKNWATNWATNLKTWKAHLKLPSSMRCFSFNRKSTPHEGKLQRILLDEHRPVKMMQYRFVFHCVWIHRLYHDHEYYCRRLYH